jgi:5-methylcytosine-specific restriction endonuclease McrBC GTP-binding regulatory subunit McrB
MDAKQYDTLVGLLRHYKNLILQGAPGVGKTYAAKRLAWSIMGEKDESRIQTVQFHQSYSYEDFIMGIRPTKEGFGIKYGAFYEFCAEARADDTGKDDDPKYFFIIDEINRGNLSKIFGELLMLIENDKRGHSTRLLYENEQFSVPRNLYIIGMMNTADRSLALIDYALRRRFAFYDIEPAFETEGFRERQEELNNPKFDSLVETVCKLNDVIAADSLLGKGFRIGHDRFCGLVYDEAKLSEIVEYSLIPLLAEYWVDEPDKVNEWTTKLREAVK